MCIRDRSTGRKVKRMDQRNKVPLSSGHGLADWVRLVNTGKDLSGRHGQNPRITKEEVQQHKTKDDCWIILKGKVYNVTEYLNYHPGGVEKLMMAAGKDATSLFDKYHGWVNYEFLLQTCFVGILVIK
eukprot:TRINITY_DN9166_c0_g1_i1.p1 TRINITY_DN9166_c0_g1~~TRINITY_DN9166_c0_g1_i1.p1  ORF type:complete len:128 (-),score=25.68 TRINITY_DN9166_c0_g1_i1:124-507(-)